MAFDAIGNKKNDYTVFVLFSISRGLKKWLHFGFYNYQIFFKKGEAKLT